MEILGVGPLEFVFVLILMLLLLGPKGMVKVVHDVGEFLRKLVQSPVWKSIINSSQEIREVQTQIIKESGLDQSLKDIRATTQSLNEVTNNLVRPALDQAKIDPISMTIPKGPDTKTNVASVVNGKPSTEHGTTEITADTFAEPVPVPESISPTQSEDAVVDKSTEENPVQQ
jgi:Sec-independent protein translocase protein TatA